MFFLVDDTSSLVKALINATHGINWGSDLSQEDGFLESGLSCHFAGIVESSSCRDDLTGT